MAWSSSIDWLGLRLCDWKGKKMSREGKKTFASFVLISGLCAKAPGHPNVALAGPLSPMESLGMHHLGIWWVKESLFGKPAVQLLKLNLQQRRVLGHLLQISTIHWHRSLQFTKHFHVHFLPWPLQNICELYQTRQMELREFKWL